MTQETYLLLIYVSRSFTFKINYIQIIFIFALKLLSIYRSFKSLNIKIEFQSLFIFEL